MSVLIKLKMSQSSKRKVTFVTPTKSKKVVVSTPKKILPVCISSLKTRGLHKILEYVKKVGYTYIAYSTTRTYVIAT